MRDEMLREAAALMRERAEAATAGPWSCDAGSGVNDLHFGHVRLPVLRGPNTYGPSLQDTEHIASWHPAVALVVADWLDEEAEYLDTTPSHKHDLPSTMSAVAVAATYLGRTDA